ncbi:Alpha/Beta hydrolase protein [Aspergillus cavernicola]|uniref:Alpha/Beta hydrolase protein n=1 Tax=Aspergillus cavernicola TaxID=176166 RepID=A0ABR4I9E2_9EURO
MSSIVGDELDTVHPQKGSLQVLWETKWRIACENSVYPFHDGKLQDFEPIFARLIADNINDAYSDAYTQTFFPFAESLEQQASAALNNGDNETASDLLLRAAVVYRISRFPYVGPEETGVKRVAFERQKKVYLVATSFWEPAIKGIVIPHIYRAGRDGSHIPVYIRIPDAASHNPVPCVLIMTGLDSYRPDNSQRTHEIIARGWGVVICEIPGTADSPADPADPKSPDRLWNSVVEYLAYRPEFDMSKIAVWGLRAGGFYAVRAAHRHRARFAGCIAHGPGSHHFLDPQWLLKVEEHGYPFPILRAWAKKFGFNNPAEFRIKVQRKFCLLTTGILGRPCTRLLLLNGIDDSVVPNKDGDTLCKDGSRREGRSCPELRHMGYPKSVAPAYKWLEDVL